MSVVQISKLIMSETQAWIQSLRCEIHDDPRSNHQQRQNRVIDGKCQNRGTYDRSRGKTSVLTKQALQGKPCRSLNASHDGVVNVGSSLELQQGYLSLIHSQASLKLLGAATGEQVEDGDRKTQNHQQKSASSDFLLNPDHQERSLQEPARDYHGNTATRAVSALSPISRSRTPNRSKSLRPKIVGSGNTVISDSNTNAVYFPLPNECFDVEKQSAPVHDTHPVKIQCRKDPVSTSHISTNFDDMKTEKGHMKLAHMKVHEAEEKSTLLTEMPKNLNIANRCSISSSASNVVHYTSDFIKMGEFRKPRKMAGANQVINRGSSSRDRMDGRRVSLAKEYTFKLQQGNETADNWDLAVSEILPSVQEHEDEFLEDILPGVSHQGRKRGKVGNVRAKMNCCKLLWHDFKTWYKRRKYRTEGNLIFRNLIKLIEGQFGSGTVSFFIFIRWLLLLNTFLCVVWLIIVVLPQAVFFEGYSELWQNFYFRNFLDGKHALSKSWMFYGGYSSKLGPYPLAFLYLCCAIVTYFGSLFICFKSIAEAVGLSGSTKDTHQTYSTLLFASWDYSVTDSDAVVNLSSSLVNVFKDLISEAKAKVKEERHEDKRELYLRRAAAWMITIVLIGGGCVSIFFLITMDITQVLEKLGIHVSPEHMLVVYGPTLLFMAINALVPLAVFKLPQLEQYSHGKIELYVSTLRVFVLRMANILALIFSLYKATKKKDTAVGCTGTFLGQELYKLVVLDTIIQTVLQLLIKFIAYYWTEEKKEFHMSPRVLVIVYRQALIWLGTLFCPIMPLVGMISMTIFFFVSYIVVKRTCIPPVKRWNQARRNTLFLGLTAATLIILLLPVSLIMYRNDIIQLWDERDNPGSEPVICGPFSNETITAVFWTFKSDLLEAEPVIGTIVEALSSAVVVVPFVFIIISVVYFQHIRQRWQKDQIRKIQTELHKERENNRDLLKRNHMLSDGPRFHSLEA